MLMKRRSKEYLEESVTLWTNNGSSASDSAKRLTWYWKTAWRDEASYSTTRRQPSQHSTLNIVYPEREWCDTLAGMRKFQSIKSQHRFPPYSLLAAPIKTRRVEMRLPNKNLALQNHHHHLLFHPVPKKCMRCGPVVPSALDVPSTWKM